ncbi:LysM peptidoglycan-binding domain-containing protein [Oryzomonas rubra]|uniref:LysM domain-containing protein n=1 Tax=Oryzomonas rubra TaxID=2509454 RepID=A0A5A9X8G9_9BACT|nr:LysM peptidoglycan-binding domain-containing protein [Oryzomonas rubra]KAA0888778.1 hypothetical protein ET418_15470 [Oryzomonas rubra]
MAKTVGNGAGSWLGPWSPTVIDAGTQQLPFLFECYNNKTQKLEWKLPLYISPENYSAIWTPRATLTLTQAGSHEDKIGIAPPKFRVSGVFGLQRGDKVKSDAWTTGPARYRTMEQSLLSFYERYGTYQLNSDLAKTPQVGELELRFLNFSDREYWIIQVNVFTLTRNIQRPLLYQYDIQMTGMRRYDGQDGGRVKSPYQSTDVISTSDFSDCAATLNTWGSIITTIANGYEAVTSTMTSLITTMNTIATAVSNFANGITSLVNLAASVITTAISLAKTVLAAVIQIANAPSELVNAIRNSLRSLFSLQNNSGLFQQSTSSTSTSTSSSSTSSATEIMTVDLPSTVYADGTVVKMGIPEDTIFSSTIETTAPKASSYRSITNSDTIYSIAQATGATWKSIATLNNIEYPYISESTVSEELAATLTAYAIPAGTTVLPIALSPTPVPGSILLFPDGSTSTVNSATSSSITLDDPLESPLEANARVSNHAKELAVLKPGDKILIPGDSSTTSGVSTTSKTDLESKLFGIDEYLDDDGNIIASQGSDITVAAGMTNLEMQLQHRIMTMKGELTELGHPGYGSLVPAYIGEVNTEIEQERILLECINTIKSDPRVQDVTNAVLKENEDAFYFEGTVQPINNLPSTLVSIPLS